MRCERRVRNLLGNVLLFCLRPISTCSSPWRDGRLDAGILQFIELTAWRYLALARCVVFTGRLDRLLLRIHKARG
jgi:hypothetical protein